MGTGMGMGMGVMGGGRGADGEIMEGSGGLGSAGSGRLVRLEDRLVRWEEGG